MKKLMAIISCCLFVFISIPVQAAEVSLDSNDLVNAESVLIDPDGNVIITYPDLEVVPMKGERIINQTAAVPLIPFVRGEAPIYSWSIEPQNNYTRLHA